MVIFSGCHKDETYTITFNANGGTGTMAAQTFTEGEAQALTVNAFVCEGRTFAGWNTVADGTGVSYTDGQTITATSDMTLYAQWIGHGWVDLGLPSGLKWATCNVGAANPEDYGDYFAWGETQPKDEYTEDNCTCYDTPDVLPASADAATVNWGNGWRMPTKAEMQELMKNCTCKWTTQSNVNGYLVTGPNGNSIFLPAAGYRDGTETYDVGSGGYYWSSSVYGSSRAWYLFFGSGHRYGRGCGLSVRPVRP